MKENNESNSLFPNASHRERFFIDIDTIIIILILINTTTNTFLLCGGKTQAKKSRIAFIDFF